MTPPLARRRRAQRIDPRAARSPIPDRQLLVAPLLLLPVPVLPRGVSRRPRADPAIRHRPLDHRGARQRAVGRGDDALDDAGQADRVRGVGRHRRPRRRAATSRRSPTNTPSATFATSESVMLVAIGVIGGLGSIVGPLLGAAWVIGLPTLFPDFAGRAAARVVGRPARARSCSSPAASSKSRTGSATRSSNACASTAATRAGRASAPDDAAVPVPTVLATRDGTVAGLDRLARHRRRDGALRRARRGRPRRASTSAPGRSSA